MGIAITDPVPSRTYPQIPAVRGPELPAYVPGGPGGEAPLPSRISFPLAQGGNRRGGYVRGGAWGPIRYFQPSIDKTAPFYVGGVEMNVPVLRRGIDWLRGRFPNTAGLQSFKPVLPATPNWTSNRNNPAAPPASAIPWTRKGYNGQGGLRREAYVDEQLFDLLPAWVIQKPIQHRVKISLNQPTQRAPYQPRLTKWFAAASYGQTTQTLVSQQAMQNVLQSVAAAQGQTTTTGGNFGAY